MEGSKQKKSTSRGKHMSSRWASAHLRLPQKKNDHIFQMLVHEFSLGQALHSTKVKT
jgi:hypothetical protein